MVRPFVNDRENGLVVIIRGKYSTKKEIPLGSVSEIERG